MDLHPPVIPGLTQGADGSPDMKTLFTLAMLRSRDKKRFDKIFDAFKALVTPREPPPEPSLPGMMMPPAAPPTGRQLGF